MVSKLGKSQKPIILIAVKAVAFSLIGLCLAIAAVFLYYTYNMPRPEQFSEPPLTQSTKIYDRTGTTLLYDIYGEEKRTVVPFDQISDNLKHAVLTSEDARFYQHGAIDPIAIVRSFFIDVFTSSPSQGASTITQQLVRSVYLNDQKTVGRKIQEIVLSIELEQKYSKDQIFDWYLNKIPFGENAYGAEAAAQTYFNEPASQLDVAHAAVLTALIPAPSYYSPYGPHKDQLFQRKDYILGRMKDLGYITDQQLQQAKQEQITFAPQSHSIKAPDFVMYVKGQLEQKYGDNFIEQEGLKVYTTLDWDLQSYAEQVIKAADQKDQARRAYNAALVAIDPATGEILALVGSKDYFAKSYPDGCDQQGSGTCLFSPKFDVATQGLRQPGSSFKPFVYATAFGEGYTPDTKLWDVKTEFNPNCSPDGNQQTDQYGLQCYHPRDYEGTYQGLVSLRSAIDQSLNIPSVKLLYLAGEKSSLYTAQKMGITTLNDPSRYGLSLVLGGGEVTLLDMTSAYGVFAAEGMKNPPVAILKIEDGSGKVLENYNPQPVQVLDTQVAREINNVLSDNNARTPVFSLNNALNIPGYQVAAKTGTTENDNDAWTIGYTPFVSIGVWVGNNDNSPTKDIGIGLAAPIWHQVMLKELQDHPQANFTTPNPPTTQNPVLSGNISLADPPHSILYYLNKDDLSGPLLNGQNTDPMYSHWETAVQNYAGAYYTPPPETPELTPSPTPPPTKNTPQ